MIRSIAADGRPDLGGVFRPIDRPRVLERLATAAQYRIATIIAPAGFGKSVAIRQFIENVAASVVYDAPSDATTLLPFVRGFADALAGVVPALRRSLATALDGARDSDSPSRELAAWAATHVRGLDMLIVIDDLHVGEGDPEISRFITGLVERTRDGPRWLFSSRSPLQLPVASWLAYGESDLVIDAVDLRFDLDEAKQSARATRIAVRDDELSAILELIDGWPAALTFALRTSTRASDLRAVSAGTREMVYRYLAEQVWNSLDDRVRTFLRTAVFLPRLETRLAVAAGFDDAAAIIESLRERVAFITVVETGVYKLHSLFRDFVERQVQLEGDDALRAARMLAARVLEGAGMPGPALERYLETRAVDDIERILATLNFTLLEGGQYDVVERALRLVPPVRSTRSGVLALRAAIEDSHGRVEQAEKWYTTVLEREGDDVSFRVSVAWRFALLLYQQGRFEGIPRLEELLEREDLSPVDRAQVSGTLGMVYALAGRREDADRAIAEAMELAQFADDELRARTYGRAATVAFYAADEDAVEYYTREATRLAADCGAFSVAARLYSTLYSLHSLAGRTAAAAWYAAQIATNAEKAGDPQMRAMGLRAGLELEAERGNAERVAEIERDVAALAYRGHVGLLGLLTGRAITLAWGSAFRDAQALLQSATDRDLRPYQQRIRYALLAVVAAAAQNRRDATAALAAYDRAVAQDDDARTVFDRARALAERYAVLANLLIGRNAVAGRMLRALRYPREDCEHFDAALKGIANRTPERVEAALRGMRLAGLGGIARFVEAVTANQVDEEPQPAGELALTAVELQVLRAMAQGLSNQAIADDQQRTINTVRTHVSSILKKLGAVSRGEAVAMARRRELV